MPLYRKNDKLIYFAHIPKCAGSSISTYLARRLGKPAFEDREYFIDREKHRWNSTSPQHIPAHHLERILPARMIDVRFSVVRHPEDRIQSIYDFQRNHQRRIPKWMPFSAWLRTLPLMVRRSPWFLDGHLQPQVAFVTPNTDVFHLEEGLTPIVSYLDAALGESCVHELGHEKKGKAKKKLRPAEARIVQQLYAADYEAFGYKPRD